MAKCENCGEMNPDTNAYCSKCGQPIVVPSEKSAFDTAFENAQKEFEIDAKVSADKSKLTYVCELCGTINKIENGRCSKCGKPRPRSEYIKALNDYKNSADEAAIILAEKAKAEAEAQAQAAAQAAAEQAKAEAEAKAQAKKEATENGTAIQEPVQEYVEATEQSVLRGAKNGANAGAQQRMISINGQNVPAPMGTQSGPVVQPFVIVPYVDSNQKLWQYQPRQVYKFQPYSFEEKDARAQKAMELQKGADPTYEELCRMRDRKNGEVNSLNEIIDSKLPVDQRLVTFNAKREKIRRCALASLIFSVVMIIATWILPVFMSAKSFTGLEVFKYLGNCLFGESLVNIPLRAAGIAYNGPACFVLPISYIIFAVLGIAMAIQSVVRLVTGKAPDKGYVMPLICLLLCVATFISLLAFSAGTFNGATILSDLENIAYGFYLVVVASVGLTVIGAVTPVNVKRVR